MQRFLILVAVVAAVALTVGCADQEPEITELETGAEAEVEVLAEPEMTTEPEPVEVADDGTVYDPPIDPERLPEDVWYCDMGTTHYAQMDQGEGTCPVCGMQLVEKPAEQEPAES